MPGIVEKRLDPEQFGQWKEKQVAVKKAAEEQKARQRERDIAEGRTTLTGA